MRSARLNQVIRPKCDVERQLPLPGVDTSAWFAKQYNRLRPQSLRFGSITKPSGLSPIAIPGLEASHVGLKRPRVRSRAASTLDLKASLTILLACALLCCPRLGRTEEHGQSRKARNWTLVEADVSGSETDMYIDLNSRTQVSDGQYAVATLQDNRGRMLPIEIFRDDGAGKQYSFNLDGKRYRSVINVEIFLCQKKRKRKRQVRIQTGRNGARLHCV